MGAIKKYLVKFAEKIYFKIFKIKPTKDIYDFINNLGWIFMAIALAKILILVMNVIGGRILGPEKYGQLNVIISVASFLTIPIFLFIALGLIKFVAEEKKIEKKKAVYSTIWIYFVVSLIFFSCMYFIFRNYIYGLFKVNEIFFIFAAIFAFFWALWSFMEVGMQGLMMMKKMSLIIIIANLSMFAVFLYFLISGTYLNSIYLIYIPLIVNYLVYFIVGFFFVRKYFVFKFESKIFVEKILPYGFWATILTLSGTIFGGIDRLMLNYFLGATSVGIYQAYYFSSIMMMGVLTGIFVTVFLPTSLQYKDKRGILNKLNKFLIPFALFVLLIMPLVTFTIVKIYNYEINILYIVLFTFATLLSSLFVIYSALLNSLSAESIKRNSIGMIISFVVNIAMNYLLIPVLGITGSIIATIVSLAFLTIYVRINLNKLIK